jgi:hypothetical protein
MTRHDQCHETVDPETRKEMLTEYKHKCQCCGRCGPEAGGLATLHVHHLTRDLEEMDEHDPENLTVLCRSCHSWQHQQTTEEDVPVTLTDEDVTVLLPQDVEVLRILADSGPLSTGGVAAELSMDLTVTAVRERLWVLMGLESLVASRDRQIVDQDVDTGKWGLVGQVEQSARGRIPTDPQTLLQRIQDEVVRQALDRGCDRDAIMAVLDISRRTTFYREKRAHAYALPLDAIDRRNGGRPPADDAGVSEAGDATEPGERSETPGDAQQRLDTVADGKDQENARAVDATEQPTGASSGEREQRANQASSAQPEVQDHIQQAIAALETLDEAL